MIKWILFSILIETFAIAMNTFSSGMQNSWTILALIGFLVGTVATFSPVRRPGPPDHPPGEDSADDNEPPLDN